MSFKFKDDAVEYAAHRLKRRQRIKAGLEAPFEAITLSDWVSAWLVPRKRGKISSWSGDETKLNNYWLPHLGPKLLHAISRTEIERLLELLITDGLSPAYRNRHRALLHKLYADAIIHEPPHATLNPVTKIALLSEKAPKVAELADKGQAMALIRGYGQHGPQWEVLAGLMALAGARIDEAVVMRFGDVDHHNGTLTFARIWEIKSKSIQQRTKGQREGGQETIMLLPELCEILMKWRARATRQDSDFIVSDSLGGHYTYWQAYRIHNLVMGAHPHLPQITPHGFRHFFGRYLRLLGFSGDDLKGMLRHTDLKVTERYAPIDMRHLQARARLLGVKS